MTRRSRRPQAARLVGSFSPAKQASVLFLAAGLMTLVENHLPGGRHDVINDWVALTCLAVSPMGWLLPWKRWPISWTLAYFPLALGLIDVNTRYGATPSEAYGLWFVVAFVWVGLHHPPRTPLLLAVPAASAYLPPP